MNVSLGAKADIDENNFSVAKKYLNLYWYFHIKTIKEYKIKMSSNCSFKKHAADRPVAYLDEILNRPFAGLLQSITIVYKDKEPVVLPAFSKWGKKHDLHKELKPQIEAAVRSGESVKLYMNIERSEGMPIEKVFIASYCQRVLIALANRKLPTNHSSLSQLRCG